MSQVQEFNYQPDSRFFASNYSFCLENRYMQYVSLDEYCKNGILFSTETLDLFKKAQKFSSTRKIPLFFTSDLFYVLTNNEFKKMVNLRPTRVSKALKALKREDLMPFVEKQIPIHLDTWKKVSLENPKDNVMSAVVDVSQTIVVTGFKGLVLNGQDADSKIFDENSDKFSLKFTNVKSISLDEAKVLCPKRAANGDTTLEGEYEFLAKTGIVEKLSSVLFEDSVRVEIEEPGHVKLVRNGHSESISGLSSTPKSVTFANAKSISIENADSLTVDCLTSIEPDSDAVICVEEFEPVLRLGLINSQRELSSKIEPDHILQAILQNKNCLVSNTLEQLEKTVTDPKTGVLKYQYFRRDTMTKLNLLRADAFRFKRRADVPRIRARRRDQSLDRFTTDLTKAARFGKIDDVIGRDSVIQSVARVMVRRRKNSAVLVGEPGTGKTAIAEGLALKIARAEVVPSALYGERVLSFDLTAAVAGARYRGDFEQNIRSVISSVEKDGHIILFIDEIHTILGAGSAEGSLDAANILKPALARGTFRVLGATTIKEYILFEKDAALARRFQRVNVDEPDLDDMVEVLKYTKDRFEQFHEVRVPDELVRDLVNLSAKFVKDRYFPDKAFDILDESLSQYSMERQRLAYDPTYLSTLSPLDINYFEIQNTVADIRRFTARARHAIKHASKKVIDQEMLYLTYSCGQKHYLEENRTKYLKKNLNEFETGYPLLPIASVHRVISHWTDIPTGVLGRDEKKALLDLDKNIGRFVKGQPRAVDLVAKAVRRFRLGIKSTPRPSGSFMFCGPTGVGKTELAKVVANLVFGGESALIRFDMSEYKEAFEAKKLLGAPPGYIGYEEGGLLTDAVRRRPYSVVLFDEIEKAHLSVYDLFLQVLDDGILTDSKGKKTYFSDCIIVMTSNIGANSVSDKMEKFNKQNPDGLPDSQYNILKNIIKDELKGYFRPEFLNRLDHVVVFSSLSRIVVEQIAERKCVDFINLIKTSLEVDVEISSRLKNHILDKGYQPLYGARPLRRTITELLEDPISAAVLEKKEIGKGQKVLMDLEDSAPSSLNKPLKDGVFKPESTDTADVGSGDKKVVVIPLTEVN